MGDLEIKFSTTGKAVAPKPIRLEMPGWAGSPDLRRVNGSAPQPWHCPPFVEGASYGWELVYHYETECHVYHENGQLKIDWDYANEPGGVTGADEFGVFAPLPAKYYFIASLVDIQVPEGYVLRTQPHPRFYTDDTGSVPAAIVGHVQTFWWPKKLFVVFKAPRPGDRHVFRKGEPYVQLTVVPQRSEFEMKPMTAEQAAHRRELEQQITASKSFIAKSGWQDIEGSEFNDHYRVLTRAYVRENDSAAVEKAIAEGFQRRKAAIPPGLTIKQYLDLAQQYQRQGMIVEAREMLFHIRRIEPSNAEATSRLGVLAGSAGLTELSLKMMGQAVAFQPQQPAYRNNLGVALGKAGRFAEAESAFRDALSLNPNDPIVMSNMGMVMARQGRISEGLAACQAALAINPQSPVLHFRLGEVYKEAGQVDAARSAYESALVRDPAFAPAKRALAPEPARK